MFEISYLIFVQVRNGFLLWLENCAGWQWIPAVDRELGLPAGGGPNNFVSFRPRLWLPPRRDEAAGRRVGEAPGRRHVCAWARAIRHTNAAVPAQK